MATTERIEITQQDWATLEAAMDAEGAYAGKSAGTWVIDGNSTEQDCRAVLAQIENCEFEISSPLSGEWAGDPTDFEVVNAAAATTSLEIEFEQDSDEDVEAVNDLATRWLDAYMGAFQAEAERSALAQIDDVDNDAASDYSR